MLNERDNRSTYNFWARVLLIVGKAARAYGVFLAWYYLHHFQLPVTLFVFLVILGGSMFFLPLRRPWKKKINSKQWFRVTVNTILYVGSLIFWYEGLKYYGPINTILTADFADILLSPLFVKGKENKKSRKINGSIIILLAYILLWWMGSSFPHITLVEPDPLTAPADSIIEGSDHSGFGSYLPEKFIGGVFIAVAITLTALRKQFARRFSSTLGGAKTLFSLSLGQGVLLLALPASFGLFSALSKIPEEGIDENHHLSTFSVINFFGTMVYIVTFTMIGDHFVESISSSKMTVEAFVKIGIISSVASVSIVSWWFYSFIPSFTTIIAFGIILFGIHTQYSTVESWLSTQSLPIYSGDTEKHHKPSSLVRMRSMIMHHIRSFMREVLSNSKSRRIFLFLMLNLAFMFVEFIWGMWTNSLGLISDAFHMLFDCVAVAIGLYASVISRWDRNQIFSYGYGRVEVLSAFTNGVFLVVIAMFVLLESIQRLIDPPEIVTDQLLLVSVLGLLVNIVGLVAFGAHGHDHGGGGGHGHSHGHSHTHGSKKKKHGHGHNGHGHAHDAHQHSHSHSHDHDIENADDHGGDNMWALYIHVAADALGSVGVIISSIFVISFGWKSADPICSFCIAVLIFMSVIPLLISSGQTLLQRTPEELEHKLKKIVRKIEFIEGVSVVKNMHVWKHCSQSIVGTIVVDIEDTVDEQIIRGQIDSKFKGCVHSLTIQLNKSSSNQMEYDMLSPELREEITYGYGGGVFVEGNERVSGVTGSDILNV